MKNPFEKSSLLKHLHETYVERDIEGIIKQYTKGKQEAEKLGRYWRDKVLREQRLIEERAVECLKEILHKKLFNAQCLWRAGQLDLPLKNTLEISAYERNLFRCRFLEPITRQELDEYIKYWLSDSFMDFPLLVAQDYHRLKSYVTGQKHHVINEMADKLLHHDAHYPNWYAWYDDRFNTKELLTLKDQRGVLEQKLVAAYNMSHNLDFSKTIEALKNIDLNKRTLIPSPELFHEFAVTLEDTRMLSYFRDLHHHRNTMETEEADQAITYLNDVFYRNIPVAAHEDWRQGVLLAAYEDLQKQALKHLPTLYEEYLSQDYFYDRYFDEHKWHSDQETVEHWEKIFEEGRNYIKENPDFKG